MKIRDVRSLDRIVKLRATGVAQAKVAKEFRVNRSTISRLEKKEDIQRLIEEENKRFLESLPCAVDNVKGLIEGFKAELGKKLPDKQKVEYGFKGSIKALESAGIAPGASSSVMIQNIFNQQNLISPLASDLIDKYLEGISPVNPEEGIVPSEGISPEISSEPISDNNYPVVVKGNLISDGLITKEV